MMLHVIAEQSVLQLATPTYLVLQHFQILSYKASQKNKFSRTSFTRKLVQVLFNGDDWYKNNAQLPLQVSECMYTTIINCEIVNDHLYYYIGECQNVNYKGRLTMIRNATNITTFECNYFSSDVKYQIEHIVAIDAATAQPRV